MWSLCFLGELSAERDSASVTLAPRKYTALLAYLALHPARRFGRDELADLFWPDSDSDAGRAALRTALSTLRRDFGADLFDTGAGADTVRLRDQAVETDAARFESLLTQAEALRTLPEREAALLDVALSLYKGPLLPGIYADWAVVARERLEEMRTQALARRERLRRNSATRQDGDEQERAQYAYSPKHTAPALRRLPLYTGSFIGRDDEIERLTMLLCGSAERPRFLTLTGPGGIGKTRLAVEAANIVAPYFRGAVCFVPLASANSGEEIGPALADALQIDRYAGRVPLQEALRRLLDLGASLLILDNLEQMVSFGAAPVIKTILASLPEVTLLLTSRRLIGLDGEREVPVRALSVDSGRELFLEHVHNASPDMVEHDEPALQTLCERLEGIPLAIELCASWARVLSESQMLEQLDRRFRLLVSRRQDVPQRQRSLHATLEWGCPTDPELLAFFAALSVFRGGCTLAAAEAIGGPNALEHIAALREHSLLLAEPPPGGGAMRYRMLETIREFASEKLALESLPLVQRKRLEFYAGFAARETPRLGQSDSARIFAALDQETANFREAIEFGLSDTSESLLRARNLIRNLRWCWGMRGHRMPYRDWQARIYDRLAELPEEDRAWTILEYSGQCPPEEQETLLNTALAYFERTDNMRGRADVHESLAALYRERGDYERMESSFRQAFDLHAATGDRQGAGIRRAMHAGSLFQIGRVAEARELWKECRAISVACDDFGSIAVLDRALGVSLLDEGRSAEALPLLESALQTFRHKGESWQIMDSIGHVARVLIAVGRPEESLPLLEEARQIARARGDSGRINFLRSLEDSAHQAST